MPRRRKIGRRFECAEKQKGRSTRSRSAFHSRTAKACRFKAGVAGYRYRQWTIDDAAVREFQEAVERCRRKAKACAARRGHGRDLSAATTLAVRPPAPALNQPQPCRASAPTSPIAAPARGRASGSRPAFFALAFTIKVDRLRRQRSPRDVTPLIDLAENRTAADPGFRDPPQKRRGGIAGEAQLFAASRPTDLHRQMNRAPALPEPVLSDRQSPHRRNADWRPPRVAVRLMPPIEAGDRPIAAADQAVSPAGRRSRERGCRR